MGPEKLKKLLALSVLFWIIGLSLQASAVYKETTEFHPILDRIAGLPKAQLDTAPVGSEISNLKIAAAKFPSLLMMFKLVGVGMMLSGIFLSLLGILMVLTMMPEKLGGVIKKKR